METQLVGQEADIVRGICNFPDDMTLRLGYADWLDDYGQPERAEFIRVQCELSWLESDAGGHHPNMLNYPQADYHTGQCVLCDRATDLGTRERRLFNAHANRWFTAPKGKIAEWDIRLTEPGDKTQSCWIVRRGFIEEVRCSFETYTNTVYNLFSTHPIKNVIALDRQPHEQSYTHATRGRSSFWWWINESNLMHTVSNRLPNEIIENMKGKREWAGGFRVMSYEVYDHAIDALSLQLVRHGRNLNNLLGLTDLFFK